MNNIEKILIIIVSIIALQLLVLTLFVLLETSVQKSQNEALKAQYTRDTQYLNAKTESINSQLDSINNQLF